MMKLCTHWVVAVVTRTIGHAPATTRRRSHAGFAPATGANYEQTTRARFLVLNAVADYEQPTQTRFLVLNATMLRITSNPHEFAFWYSTQLRITSNPHELACCYSTQYHPPFPHAAHSLDGTGYENSRRVNYCRHWESPPTMR
jgi:hypothetical protein